ncbi:MAG: DUF2497 domain-containing protein [Rhizobiales bacterium]|nr:DUF2497 domain-containing protein [Hyphomicrobiales bacterium]
MATNAAFQPGQTSAEPSMEEILASIRKIIADDSLGTKKDEPPPPPAPAAAPVAIEEPEPDDSDVLDLADVATVAPPNDDMLIGVGEEAPEMSFDDMPGMPEPVMVDVDMPAAPMPVPVMVTPPPAPLSTPAAMETHILSTETSGLVASAFAALSRNAAMPAPGRSIEDVVSELLRPMLRDWMDSHLPGIVERLVKAEIERVSRG